MAIGGGGAAGRRVLAAMMMDVLTSVGLHVENPQPFLALCHARVRPLARMIS
jgi:2-polyprenyl-3-methyl-5-hydroxy-6-metoxy-1,4-benzoquinol methylase